MVATSTVRSSELNTTCQTRINTLMNLDKSLSGKFADHLISSPGY